MADNNAASRTRPVLIPPGLAPHILDYFNQLNQAVPAAPAGPLAPLAGPAAGSPAAFGVGAGSPASTDTGNLLDTYINGDLLNKSLQASATGQNNVTGNPSPPVSNAGNAICYAPGVSARDNSYLNRYYAPVAAKAAQYGVDPALILGNVMESNFATPSPGNTYNKTNEAFGLTNGDPKKMTYTATPQADVDKFFDLYGNRIRGIGNDRGAYVNALQGQDAAGNPVPNWKQYNSYDPDGWRKMENKGIDQMQREVPRYVNACVPPRSAK